CGWPAPTGPAIFFGANGSRFARIASMRKSRRPMSQEAAMTNLSTTRTGGVPGGAGISWGWLLALGILMALLGVIGLGMTYWLTIVAVFWFGALAIVGGVAQLIDAFHHKGW